MVQVSLFCGKKVEKKFQFDKLELVIMFRKKCGLPRR